jgi:hypothetical protein
VAISGIITIGNIVELHTQLRDILNTAEAVDIEVGIIEDADLTFLQLLCSAHRAFLSRNKQFNVTGLKNELLSRENFAGFIREKGCTRDKFHNCALVKEKQND